MREPEFGAFAESVAAYDDWKAIDAAFAGNTDPLFGTKASAQYVELFRQIVNLAPPPIGVGAER